MEELRELLKSAVAGKVSATQAILSYFKEQQFSVTDQEQIHIYLRQAARDSHHAIYLQALLYDFGYGVTANADMSFLLMREAAAKGSIVATYEVGRRFLEGIGVEQNFENALQWLKIAAGSPNYLDEAMFAIGEIYEQGLGLKADREAAKKWYEKAAEKGHQKAQQKIQALG